ncbi:MAG: response regulator [Acidobacteria bacterium]|nr:MAG: response regulator [Acidobacteriota bacterium]
MPHVVLADDSPTIRKVVELSFAGENCELHCFSSGESALDYLRTGPVDVLLADVFMPGVDGYELCRQLKTNPKTAHVPVVLLAGTFEPFDIRRAESVGYHSYLTKPFATSRLLALVDELIKRSTRAVPRRQDSQDSPGEVPEWTSGQTAKKETGTVNQKPLFTLTTHQCRPVPNFIKAQDLSDLESRAAEAEPGNETVATPAPVAEEAKASPSMTLRQDEVDQLVGKVMERLPSELRRILAEVLRDLPARQ